MTDIHDPLRHLLGNTYDVDACIIAALETKLQQAENRIAELERMTTAKTTSLTCVEFAQRIALNVERRLRETEDPDERQWLKNARDWHFAELSDDQIKRTP